MTTPTDHTDPHATCRIHPTPHPEPDCHTCDRGSVDCCDPWESTSDPSSYAYEHAKETHS